MAKMRDVATVLLADGRVNGIPVSVPMDSDQNAFERFGDVGYSVFPNVEAALKGTSLAVPSIGSCQPIHGQACPPPPLSGGVPPPGSAPWAGALHWRKSHSASAKETHNGTRPIPDLAVNSRNLR